MGRTLQVSAVPSALAETGFHSPSRHATGVWPMMMLHLEPDNMDTLAEWLRRRPARPMKPPHVSLNPTGVNVSRTCGMSAPHHPPPSARAAHPAPSSVATDKACHQCGPPQWARAPAVPMSHPRASTEHANGTPDDRSRQYFRRQACPRGGRPCWQHKPGQRSAAPGCRCSPSSP